MNDNRERYYITPPHLEGEERHRWICDCIPRGWEAQEADSQFGIRRSENNILLFVDAGRTEPLRKMGWHSFDFRSFIVRPTERESLKVRLWNIYETADGFKVAAISHRSEKYDAPFLVCLLDVFGAAGCWYVTLGGRCPGDPNLDLVRRVGRIEWEDEG